MQLFTHIFLSQHIVHHYITLGYILITAKDNASGYCIVLIFIL